MIKIQRILPPAAAPLSTRDLVHGLAALVRPRFYRERLLQELREYLSIRHVYLVSSGKAALVVILRALRSLAPDRDEVLIPAYTCYSVPSAIVKAGLLPAVCDIDSGTYDFDQQDMAVRLTERTLCVVPGHLFGIPSDVERTAALARRHGAFVVEDAAQALGVRCNSGFAGTIGDVGFYSLDRGKNITAGSGGIIVTNNDRIAAAVDREYSCLPAPGWAAELRGLCTTMLLALFLRPSLYWFPAGLPFLGLGRTVFSTQFPVTRLNRHACGLLRTWQDRLAGAARQRSASVDRYAELLGPDIGVNERLSGPLLRMPLLAQTREFRDRLCELLQRKGLGAGTLYPAAVPEIPEIRGRIRGGRCPGARLIAERLFTVPTHGLATPADRERICSLLHGFTDSEERSLTIAETRPLATRRAG
jgi:dTDP-4-amino-4,6-dideoxygalactose transaminase